MCASDNSYPSVYRVDQVYCCKTTGSPSETHRPCSQQWQTLAHAVVSSTPRHKLEF